MLEAVPRRLFSWDFIVFDKGKPVGHFHLSWFSNVVNIAVEKQSFRAMYTKKTKWSFTLNGAREGLAYAERSSDFYYTFDIHYGLERFTLSEEIPHTRVYALKKGDRKIGRIAPRSMFSRWAMVDLPAYLPIPVRVFMILLTLVFWRKVSIF